MSYRKRTFFALLVMIVTVGALWLTNGTVTPKEATWSDAAQEAKIGGYRLISTEALWKAYSQNRDRLLLVDTRQEWEYRAGHIKDAINFPMAPTRFSIWWQKGKLGKFLGEDKDRFIVFY